MPFPLTSLARAAVRPTARQSTLLMRSSLVRTNAPVATLMSIRKASSSSDKADLPAAKDAFLQGNSAGYVEEMYSAWLKDPTSVHLSWQIYFRNQSQGMSSSQSFQAPPTIPTSGGVPSLVPGSQVGSSDVIDHLKIQLLVRAYQVRGHHVAHLDPLGLNKSNLAGVTPRELDITHYGFTNNDLDRVFSLGPGILPGFLDTGSKKTLREIIEHLQTIYCGSIGVEYIHIPDRDRCDWIRQRVEVPRPYKYTTEEKTMILDRLIWSDSFERFVSSKYPSEKRFGLEGGESLIPGMKALIDRSVEHGVESIVMGMPHRGRLNVLSNVVRKPHESIFSEFSGNSAQDGFSGDVKYHLGMNYDRPTPSGKPVHLSLVANPSHLEAADGVVLGKTHAIQHYMDDKERKRSLAVLMHGDAAFAGQGIVYETLGFMDLPSYSTGGTIHIVVNNQIGFTTDPRFARSTAYCTDIAKSINAPIFHVNADDVEAVNFVHQLAADWRKEFHTDVVIDLVCYRRHGHNETDQPSFTQPIMYHAIEKQTPVIEKYINQLVKEGTFKIEEIEEMKKRVWGILEENYAKSKDYKAKPKEWMTSSWHGFKSPAESAAEILPSFPTGAAAETLKHIGNTISSYPPGFKIHPNLARIMKARAKTIETGSNIDWATAEGLAFGTLLSEGKHVRLAGQDVERGTFSHRHAVLHDQDSDTLHVPLKNLGLGQAAFSIQNSSLSEYGSLGFELGYSLVNPNSLILWEAQFGDFANNAQCIIDQFIASGETKWLQRTGLTMLLPHGYDGQGPEHSSARIERYLQMCDDHPFVFPSEEKLARQHQDCNMQVVYCSTPANYFHVLRRQIHRDFRKPLIVFNSKLLLRHPLARSTLEEMSGNTAFKRFIPEPQEDKLVSPDKIKKHIFCSGQVYYALVKAREQNKIDDVAISRVEQLSPFPYDRIKEYSDRYPNAEIVWCQEEPLNMGAWAYVAPRIRTSLRETSNHANKQVHYAGREPSASVATGSKKVHLAEEYAFLSSALIGEVRKPTDVVGGVPVF
ncbi:2-oxoglutarate dehydrogenase E1 component [Entomortierella chlamydospora]|uniref:2-oxoglutarate dehydrogenase, mitochondrial n=1 Tax=Entomortierella chlamydospora TaxID=101097 RepID=A0A9P6N3M9_9FUNG|nr:2-oxoglutarate dehydrogenase E1 component [Entomortierella chlamydospora]KAG0024011.1 2-oxoglutarate dehydrogenase E1 component [Entomortierella chlamydospora]